MTTQEDLNKRILDAAGKENASSLQDCIDKGADVNCQNSDGFTPLHLAAVNGDTKVAYYIIKKNASLSVKDEEGMSPLHIAAKYGNAEVLNLMLNAGASPSAVNIEGRVPLHIAIWFGNEGAVNRLLKAQSSLTVVDFLGQTPLHIAAMKDSTEIVDLLLKRGAYLSVKDNGGLTPLHWAAKTCKIKILKLLLEKNSSLSARTNKGQTPLHCAASTGQRQLLDCMLNAGASLSVVDNEGLTPLHIAACGGNTEIVMYMIKQGASLFVVDKKGQTPLHCAASTGQRQLLDCMLNAGASLSVVDNEGLTPLHIAACCGSTDIVMYMIKQGASLFVVDKKGQTPLHCAASTGQRQLLDCMLNAGASLSVVDNEGLTPLHIAACCGSTDIVMYMIKQGASLFVVDKKGKTPYEVAAIGGAKTLLKEKMDNTDEIVPKIPMKDTSDDVKEPLSKGTLISYGNCVYLGGACNVGKSTLASILIGEEIPQHWKPTDGLNIYFGRNGIDLENKDMVPWKQGSDGDILSKVLRDKPDVTQAKPETNLSKNREEVLPHDSNKGYKITETHIIPQPTYITLSISTAPTPSLVPATIQEDIKEKLRKGTYKIEIAPSDLFGFAEKGYFEMTHRLCMRHRGTFVLMFNGKIDFSDPLKGYEQGETTKSILKHWVNSILASCADDEDILPNIMFCATHNDHYNKEERIRRKAKLIHDLGEIFKSHKRQHRIIYDDIYFINGKEKTDPEINRLKSKLVEVAFNQNAWGKRMQMAWIPLDLQLSELRIHNMNIISKEELITLNRRNKDLELTDKQTKDFLNVQHSLGKILYFDKRGLDHLIIVQPISLVNILRSFIIYEVFWPKDEELRGILSTLTNTGIIAKQDLLKLWSQEKFHQHMPNDDFKAFIIQVLVHLDILEELKHDGQEQESKVQSYLVPCRLPNVGHQ